MSINWNSNFGKYQPYKRIPLQRQVVQNRIPGIEINIGDKKSTTHIPTDVPKEKKELLDRILEWIKNL